MAVIALAVFGVAVIFGLVAFVAWRYQRVPADKVLVVYGRIDGETSAKLFHGGGALVLPIVQGHAWLDMTPFAIDAAPRGVETADGQEVTVSLSATVAISRTPGVTENAAERLLHQSADAVSALATDLATAAVHQAVNGLPTAAALRTAGLRDALDSVLADHLRQVGLEALRFEVPAEPVG